MAKRADPDVELVPSAAANGERAELEHSDEPPVVARLVVEIRSDGSRTIARGAIEDVARGDRTAIEAHGTSPLQLALALAKSLTQIPRLAARMSLSGLSTRSAIRGLLGRKRDK